MTLNFYTVDENYLNYLRKTESKVPNTNYTNNNKFFCGIVITINGYDYFAPISSKTKKYPTTYPIYNNNKQIIATINLKFMVPVKNEYLKIKKIEEIEDNKYKQLVARELQFCRSKKEKIKKAAKRVYQYGTDPDNEQYKYCCDFKKLEEIQKDYKS